MPAGEFTMGSDPAAEHAPDPDEAPRCRVSCPAFRIGREAFEMSVSPRQNFLKPPPVPDMPTVTLIAFFSAF